MCKNFNISDVTEVMTQTQMYLLFPSVKKLFSEENKVPGCCLMLERWQGPPHTNSVRQDEIVL